MKERSEDLPLTSLVLVPALITLAVTLVRLGGELLNWSPTFFSRAAGGAGAIVGIVWLVPVFGAYFARKLIRLGHGPASVGRAIGIPLLALLLVPATIFVALKIALPIRVGVLGVGCIVALIVAFRGWPALARTLVAYGLAARIPVVIVMLVAILGNWGTHLRARAPRVPGDVRDPQVVLDRRPAPAHPVDGIHGDRRSVLRGAGRPRDRSPCGARGGRRDEVSTEASAAEPALQAVAGLGGADGDRTR